MVNIAVMGYGTVGSGVVEVVNTNGARINQRIGDELNIKQNTARNCSPSQKRTISTSCLKQAWEAESRSSAR